VRQLLHQFRDAVLNAAVLHAFRWKQFQHLLPEGVGPARIAAIGGGPGFERQLLQPLGMHQRAAP
jgi:hypothetical protein